MEMKKKTQKTSIGLIYSPPFLHSLTFSFFAQHLYKKKKKKMGMEEMGRGHGNNRRFLIRKCKLSHTFDFV